MYESTCRIGCKKCCLQATKWKYYDSSRRACCRLHTVSCQSDADDEVRHGSPMTTTFSRHLSGPAASQECVFADGRGNATTVIARPRPGGAVASAAAATHAFGHTTHPPSLPPSNARHFACMPTRLSTSIHFSAPMSPTRPPSSISFRPLCDGSANPLSTAGPGQLMTLKSDRLQKDPVCGPQRGRRRICLGGNRPGHFRYHANVLLVARYLVLLVLATERRRRRAQPRPGRQSSFLRIALTSVNAQPDRSALSVPRDP